MYHHTKYCILVFVLSVACVTEFRCSPVSGNNLKLDSAYSQRYNITMLFQNSLMNDSGQLFTLQKAFLLPRERCTETHGIYLNVTITVTVVTASDGIHYNIYFPQNGSCIFMKRFELLPASPLTLAEILQLEAIVQALGILDPFFSILTAALSIDNNYDYYNSYDSDCNKSEYAIRLQLMIDSYTAELDQVDNDITDALYLTLSWVSAIILVYTGN